MSTSPRMEEKNQERRLRLFTPTGSAGTPDVTATIPRTLSMYRIIQFK